ncbi:MAG: hypothetical protein Kow0042_05730 [Calditrichia bacterium]
MNQKQQDFYLELRKQIDVWLKKQVGKEHRWSEYILLAPDIFHLLCKLLLDSRVPTGKKVKLGAAVAYFISPLDFLPEALLGPLGYLDDLAIAAYALNDVINEVEPKVVSENWAGDRDILNLIKTILANSDRMLGSGLWRKIRNQFH